MSPVPASPTAQSQVSLMTQIAIPLQDGGNLALLEDVAFVDRSSSAFSGK
jgi:hypothetical protein